MSVIRTTKVPEQATIMTLQDVCDFQWSIINKWQRRSDVWSFTYGLGALAGAASLSSLWIGETLRASYKVAKRNAVLILLPLFAVPPCLMYNIHTMYVVPDLFLIDMYECLLCPLAKSAMIQMGLGVAYPVVTANLIGWGVLLKEAHTRHNVPHYTEYIRLAKLFHHHTKPMFPRLVMLFLAQSVLAEGITYCQYKQLMRIKGYTMLIEEEDREQTKVRAQQLASENERLRQKKMLAIKEQENEKALAKERKEEFVLRKDVEEKERSYG